MDSMVGEGTALPAHFRTGHTTFVCCVTTAGSAAAGAPLPFPLAKGTRGVRPSEQTQFPCSLSPKPSLLRCPHHHTRTPLFITLRGRRR